MAREYFPLALCVTNQYIAVFFWLLIMNNSLYFSCSVCNVHPWRQEKVIQFCDKVYLIAVYGANLGGKCYALASSNFLTHCAPFPSWCNIYSTVQSIGQQVVARCYTVSSSVPQILHLLSISGLHDCFAFSSQPTLNLATIHTEVPFVILQIWRNHI